MLIYSKIAEENHVINLLVNNIHAKISCHAAVVFATIIHFAMLQQLHIRLVKFLTGEFTREYSCTLYKNCIKSFFIF